MPTITSTGVGSGLDVSSIVSGLMSVEKQALGRLQAQASSYQTQLSAWGSLQSQIAALGDVAGRIAAADAWNPVLADSSDSAGVSVAATSAAAAGTHAVEVQQLAQSQVLASGWFASPSAIVGTGRLVIDVGTTSGASFTPKAGTAPVEVAIAPGKGTLADVRDAINAANAGVRASIITGAQGARIVLRGNDGAAASLRLAAVPPAGDPATGLSALGWDPARADNGLAQSLAAQDAKVAIDGVEVTSPTNAVTGALEGVTITAKKVTAAPAQLTLAVQAAGVRKNVNDFVAAWNALNASLRNQVRSDPAGKSSGPLQADATAKALLQSMRSLLQGSVGGGGIDSLSAAGIALQADGSLGVTESRLAPLLAQPAQLARLFTQPAAANPAARGFGLRFKDWATRLSGTAGALTDRVGNLKQTVDGNQKRQSAEQERLARVEASLRAQYQRLDASMSGLNGQLARMKSALGIT